MPASRPRPLAPRLPAIGATIGGKYELVRPIGEGAMGVVFEAKHLRLGQRLAIKVLAPSFANSEEFVLRFEREARATARLQSINAARVIDVDTLPSGLPYLVLEYLDGCDLGKELARTGPMPVEVAVDYVVQAATAMTEAHAMGIVHRDLKPSNLFLCSVGSSARRLVKVLDFGISKMAGDAAGALTMTETAMGTPDYMSPEQVRAVEAVDARSDVWSLGVVLFELLTGRCPFVGAATAIIAAVAADPVPSPDTLRPDLPPPLSRAVLRMLTKDPARRVQSMAEVIEILAPYAPAQRIATLAADAPRPAGRLGAILVSDGLLTPDDLERALAVQQTTGQLLGRVLVDLGLVSQPDLLVALAKQQGLVPEAKAPVTNAEPSRVAETVVTRPSGRRRRVMWAMLGAVVACAALVTAFAVAKAPATPPPASTAPSR